MTHPGSSTSTEGSDAVVLTLPVAPETPVASVQGTLALDLGPRLEPPEPVTAPRAGIGGGHDVVAIDVAQRRRLERHTARIGAAVVEIVGGDRPASQLVRWTTPEVYADLFRRATLVAQSVGRRPGQGRLQAVRPQLIAAHTCVVSESAAEVSLHVRYGARSRAVAARFELIRGRWQVSALEFA